MASLAAVLTGCAPQVVPIAGDPPQLRPDLMVAQPVAASAGDTVSLAFPQGTDRGLLFDLERGEGERWEIVYHLVSTGNGDPPAFFRPTDEGPAVPDVGVAGRGPDRVVIPPDVAPGSYRICADNAAESFCTLIEIVASESPPST